MKFDVVVNAPMEPRTFPVSAVINGVPCIPVSNMDAANPPSETIKVYCRDGSGDATSQHDTPDGPVQEVHEGDFIGVCSKWAEDFPATLNSYLITKVRNGRVITVNAVL